MLASTVDQRALRWLGHVERMNTYRIARRADCGSGKLVWGRPRLGLMDAVKVALGSREIAAEAARQ